MKAFLQRRSLLDKVLLVAGGSALLTFIIFQFFTWHPPRHYILPEDFSGWVTVKYEKPGVPPFPRENGNLIIEIPESGILETNDQLSTGWGKDVFYRRKMGGLEEIPQWIKVDNVASSWIHGKKAENMRLDSITYYLPQTIDTFLFEGTHISLKNGKGDINSGRKVLQHFFVPEKPQDAGFQTPKLPVEREFW